MFANVAVAVDMHGLQPFVVITGAPQQFPLCITSGQLTFHGGLTHEPHAVHIIHLDTPDGNANLCGWLISHNLWGWLAKTLGAG